MALVNIADKATATPDSNTRLLGVNGSGATKTFPLSDIAPAVRGYATVAADGLADYTTIAAALAAGAKVIALKAGETHAGGMTIDEDDVLIIGNGAIFTEPASGNTFSITGARVWVQHVTVTGAFDGDPDNLGDSLSGTAFHVTGAGATLERVTVENVSGFGVYSVADKTIVKDSAFTNVATDPADLFCTSYCLHFNGSHYSKAFNNTISGWNQAIGFWYSSYGEAFSNTLTDNYGYLDTGGGVRGTRSAVEVYGESGSEVYATIIHHNHIDGATSHCIELADRLRGVKAHHNYMKGFGAGNINGIGVAAGAFGVSGSTGDDAYEVTVEKNYIVGAAGSTRASCGLMGYNVTIRDNEFVNYEATAGCLQPIEAALNLSLIGNVFRECGRTIYMSEANTHGAAILDNKVYGFVEVGGNWRSVYIQAGRGHTVAGNQFYEVGDYAAIMVDSNVEGATVKDNKSFAGSGAAAGRIQDIAKRTKLLSNYVEGETQTYSYYLNGTDTTFDNNESVGGQVYFHTAATGKGRDNYVLNYARNAAGTITNNSGGGMVLTATLP